MVDGLIYHYCGVDAFFNIIQNSTLMYKTKRSSANLALVKHNRIRLLCDM